MLGPIRAVTITVPALDPIEQAYTRYLHMRVAARGTVGARRAAAWDAPGIAACRMLTLLPEIGDQTCLRFVEDPVAGLVPPFTTFGWNATELTVRDPDAIAASLTDSPFKIIGPPRKLKGFEWITAMQVLGPAGECLYLTDVSADASLAPASCAVGQVFIVVAGGPDIAAMSEFYASRFGCSVSAPVRVPISVVNMANGLAPEQRHDLALVTLPGGTRIELDQYPACTVQRPTRAGHLPPGMAIVSFAFAGLSVCVTGAAGERIELIAPQAESVG